MKFLAVLFYLFSITVSVFATCPSEDLISPCECTHWEEFNEVECKGITLDKLKNVLNAFGKSTPIDLLLEESKLGSIPSNFFAGHNIRRLEFEHCNIVRLSNAGELPFQGIEETLEELEIVSSFTDDTEDTTLQLSHLKNLLFMDLANNVINELGNDCFPDSMVTLEITGNGIEKLGDRAFANLKNIETLALDGNRFGAISRSMIPNPANSLVEFMLEDNAFTSIPEDLFTNMPALKTLSLWRNGIKRIEEGTFKSIWSQLDTLNMEENPLECDDPHIDWMKKMTTPVLIRGKCSSPHDRRDVDLGDLIK